MAYLHDNTIVYPNHKVVLDRELHESMPEYLGDMYEELLSWGSAVQHAKHLKLVNNDGSWRVVCNDGTEVPST